MAVYRITRFAAPDMDKLNAFAEGARSQIEAAGAISIDVVSYGNGKGVVLAKYPDQASMDAATAVSEDVFGAMAAAGLIDGDSIHPHAGVVINSF